MDSTRASAIRLFASSRSTVLPPVHATSRRCDARPSYYSEEPGRRALRARDLVEGGRELDPSARERAEVRQALQDDHPAPRITRCIGKSSEVKSGRRAQYSSKKSKPMVFAPLATSHSADSGGNQGDSTK